MLVYFFFNIKNYDKATISLIAASLGAIFAGVSSFGTFLNVQEMRRQREQSISPFFIIKTPTLNFELSNGINSSYYDFTKTPSFTICNTGLSSAYNVNVKCYYDVITYIKFIKRTELFKNKYEYIDKGTIKIKESNRSIIMGYPTNIFSTPIVPSLKEHEPEESMRISLLYTTLLQDYLLCSHNFDLDKLYSSLKLPDLYLQITYKDCDKNNKEEIIQLKPQRMESALEDGKIKQMRIGFNIMDSSHVPKKYKKAFPVNKKARARYLST